MADNKNVMNIKQERIKFIYSNLKEIISSSNSENSEKLVTKLKSLPVAVRMNGITTVLAYLQKGDSDLKEIYRMLQTWFLEQSPLKIFHQGHDLLNAVIELSGTGKYLFVQREAQLFFEEAKLLAQAIKESA